jgi:hypothetical protein
MITRTIEHKMKQMAEQLRELHYSDDEIVKVFKTVEELVYEEVVDKIIDGLDEEHYAKLDELMREGKSAEEIVKVLPVREDWYNELLLRQVDIYMDNLGKNQHILQQSLA